MQTQHYRTLWLSDVHLGAIQSRADDLSRFLQSVSADTIYLVGDIVDLERMKVKPTSIESHRSLLGQLLGIADGPSRVVYIPGNHDIEFRRMAGQELFGIEIRLEAEHTTADGDRYLVFHGDALDAAIRKGTNLERFASAAYTMMVEADVRFNALRSRFGGQFSPLSTRIKNKLRAANEYILRFEETAAGYAGSRGFDGVICGHIHRPGARQIEGVRYINDGDWVEHRTAIAEDAGGALHLLRYRSGGIELDALFEGGRSDAPGTKAPGHRPLAA
ncbi:MAG: UDP-2,3-diacylglucosamine diphosphatase [Pseudomonadota bacterium]